MNVISRIKNIIRVKLWSRQQINGKNSDSIVPVVIFNGLVILVAMIGFLILNLSLNLLIDLLLPSIPLLIIGMVLIFLVSSIKV